MKTARLWCILALAGLGAFAGAAQSPPPDDDQYETLDRGGYPDPVFIFNDRIVDLAIDRIAAGMVNHYKLDDDQLWETKRVLKQRFPEWIQANRTEIIDLTNQYIEALLADEPPPPETVAEWATRVQPLVDQFNGLFVESTEEFREFFTPEQQLILDGEMAVYNVAMNHFNGRLGVWSAGGFDWESEWPRGPEFKQTQAQREEQLEAEAIHAKMQAMGQDPGDEPVQYAIEGGASPGVQPAADAQPQSMRPDRKGPKDEWELYVERFIARYQLTDDQKAQAIRILHKHQSRRDAYLRRKATEIDALYKQFEGATAEDKRAEFRTAYEKLNAPLTRYFEQLKADLDRLPTRRQRAAAAQADLEATPRDQPAATMPDKAGTE